MSADRILKLKFEAFVDERDANGQSPEPQGNVEKCECFLHVKLDSKTHATAVAWTETADAQAEGFKERASEKLDGFSHLVLFQAEADLDLGVRSITIVIP